MEGNGTRKCAQATTARPPVDWLFATVGGVPLYALGAVAPRVDHTAFVHPDAVVIGDVTIGPGSSVWPGAVLRGDGSPIVIGAHTSVQDGAVIHCTAELSTTVGDECTIGHLVHLEGCVVESRCLIGVGAVVLHEVVVGTGAIVAANAVVLDGTVVPAGALALGVPAKIREGAANPDLIIDGIETYTKRTARYRAELRRID
jgi:carbonic anhydrase/acetyltransferase-like protein (isoleucine patch superfamily)